MNHRERVLTALNHKEPDRVPIDLWGSASRICNDLYFRIAEYLGLDGYGDYERASRCSDYVDYRISDIIDADFRHINIGKPKYFEKRMTDDGVSFDEWGIGTKRNINDKYPVVVYSPLAGADIDDIDKHKWPIPEDPGRIEGIKEKVENWVHNTDYSITATPAVSGLAFDICPFLRGFEDFFINLYSNPKFAEKLIQRVTDIITETNVHYLKPIGKYLDWVEFTSDYGMQDRPFISSEKFRQFFLKPNKKLFETVKKFAPNAKIFLHSCGSVRELIPDFIEMGVDILNSLQPRAKGMDSFELKKEFGKDLIFHGGVDIQGGIIGSLDGAIEESKIRIKAFAPNGGYIFGPSNHFLEDTPVENFFAIYETAKEFGKYPIETNS